jgi:DNA primase
MLKEIIEAKIKGLGKPIQPSGKGFILTTCFNPNHQDKHPSFSVNLENGYGICFSCSYKINKKFWLFDVEDEDMVDDIMRQSLYKKVEEIFSKTGEKEKVNVLFPPHSEKELPEVWRGLTKETMTKYGLYFCDYGHFEDRIIFPMPDYDGTPIAFNSRALGEIKDGMQKYKYSKGLNVYSLIYPPVEPYTPYIVLCEGVMDALSLVQSGIPAIFNFGVNNTFGADKISQLLKQGVETIYLMFDQDKVGQEAVIKYLQSDLSDYFEIKHARLLKDLVPFYTSDCKDYNEFISK